jgi:hypothetical protein
MAHRTAVAPPRGEELALVNAEVVLQHGHDLVREGDVLAAVVGPAGVEAVGRHEDGAVAGPGLQVVEAAAGHVVHVSVTPVVSDDDSMSLVAIVVVGQLEDVLSLLAVDCHGLGAGGWRCFAAAGRGRLDGLDGSQKGQSESGDGDHVVEHRAGAWGESRRTVRV